MAECMSDKTEDWGVDGEFERLSENWEDAQLLVRTRFPKRGARILCGGEAVEDREFPCFGWAEQRYEGPVRVDYKAGRDEFVARISWRLTGRPYLAQEAFNAYAISHPCAMTREELAAAGILPSGKRYCVRREECFRGLCPEDNLETHILECLAAHYGARTLSPPLLGGTDANSLALVVWEQESFLLRALQEYQGLEYEEGSGRRLAADQVVAALAPDVERIAAAQRAALHIERVERSGSLRRKDYVDISLLADVHDLRAALTFASCGMRALAERAVGAMETACRRRLESPLEAYRSFSSRTLE